MEGQEEKGEEGTPSVSFVTREEEDEEGEAPVEEGLEMSELEEELRREEEIILLHERDSLLERVRDHQIKYNHKLNISWV